jgi:hypothetical protein
MSSSESEEERRKAEMNIFASYALGGDTPLFGFGGGDDDNCLGTTEEPKKVDDETADSGNDAAAVPELKANSYNPFAAFGAGAGGGGP